MNRKVVSRMMLTLLLVSILTLTFNIQKAESLEPPETEWTRTYGGADFDGYFFFAFNQNAMHACAELEVRRE